MAVAHLLLGRNLTRQTLKTAAEEIATQAKISKESGDGQAAELSDKIVIGERLIRNRIIADLNGLK
jgi:hypothetical protein